MMTRRALAGILGAAALLLGSGAATAIPDPPILAFQPASSAFASAILADPGSDDVLYAEVNPGPTAPIVVGDGVAFFVGTGPDSHDGFLYRIDSAGTITRTEVGVGTSAASPTAAVGDSVAVSTGVTGEQVSLVAPDGTVQTVAVPPEETTVNDAAGRYLSVLSSDGRQLFAVRNNEQAIYLFDTEPSLAFVERIATPETLPPPAIVQPVGDGRLLIWSPAALDVADGRTLAPGGGFLDLASGEFSPIEGGVIAPGDFGGARVVATTMGNPIQVADDLEPGAGPPDAFPLAQGRDGVTWSATPTRGEISWTKDGRTVIFRTATTVYTRSCPFEAPGAPPVCAPVEQPIAVMSAAVAPSGALVFTFGNTIGYIAAPTLPPLTPQLLIPMVAADGPGE